MKNGDVTHKHVKMFCDKIQFPVLNFFPYIKPYSVWGFSNHYHL